MFRKMSALFRAVVTRPQWIAGLGVLWAAVLFVLTISAEPTPENKTLVVSITLSGVYTVLLAMTRRWWLPRLAAGKPLRNAMALGIFNAAVIETLFLVVQYVFGAEGVAASPNLLIDLLITMPWYIGMVVIFVRVQHRRRFSAATVLLLGALYEVGADGVVGGAFEGTIFTPVSWFLLLTIVYWEFILVYSSMVLPPAWVIETVPPPPPPEGPAWRDAVRPLYWLLPFVGYLAVVFVVGGVLSELL